MGSDDCDLLDGGKRLRREINLPPDRRVAEVLTRNPYPLPDAIAELVDNSIDANATRVLVRFLRDEKKVLSIQVIDNGDGISPSEFDHAMQFGYRNPHKKHDIGMYGVGMKTSSLSQADELRVYSKIEKENPQGRQWLREHLNSSRLQYLTSEEVDKAFRKTINSDSAVSPKENGTIVEWRKVHDFERSVDMVESYLKREMRDIENHLGLVFHRLIERNQVELFLDVIQNDKIVGSPLKIHAINPFGYQKSGDKAYPKLFSLKISGIAQEIDAVAHIWPPRTKQREYKIPRSGGRANTIDSQGLYIYFNDRLIMPGGWANVRTAEAHFSLARMEINLTPEAMKVLVIGYSKNNVRIPSSFVEALRSAIASDGSTYSAWVDRAQEIFRTPDSNAVSLSPLPQPKSGLPRSVIEAFREAEAPAGAEVSISWADLNQSLVFKVDRSRNRLILNKKYKKEIIHEDNEGIVAATYKTLLILALRNHFGARQGPKQKALESEYQHLLMSLIQEAGEQL